MTPSSSRTQSPGRVRSQTGSTPVLLHKDVLARIAPAWDRTARALHDDASALAALEKQPGLTEAYAFALAAASAAPDNARFRYHVELVVQPPFDADLAVDTCQRLDPLPVRARGTPEPQQRLKRTAIKGRERASRLRCIPTRVSD